MTENYLKMFVFQSFPKMVLWVPPDSFHLGKHHSYHFFARITFLVLWELTAIDYISGSFIDEKRTMLLSIKAFLQILYNTLLDETK